MKESRGAFRVLGDSYVTEETGTGIVHQAPYFGEVSLSPSFKLPPIIRFVYLYSLDKQRQRSNLALKVSFRELRSCRNLVEIRF